MTADQMDGYALCMRGCTYTHTSEKCRDSSEILRTGGKEMGRDR